MSRGPWKKNQQENMDKAQAVAVSADMNVSTVLTQTVTPSLETIPDKPILAKEPTTQNATSHEKKRLPKLTISYYDKKGSLVIKEYTCATLNLTENTETTLTGEPTSRRDIVNLSLEAQVVAIN